MRKKLTSVLLSLTLVLATVDITAFAVEQDTEESVAIETQQTEETGEENEGITSGASEIQSEGSTEKDTEEHSEKTTESEVETETEKTTENVTEIETQTQEESETEKTETEISETSESDINEAETEFEMYGNETVSNGSSNDLNTAVYDKLNKYRSDSMFGNGVIWGGTTNGSYNWNGWRQCCGFALQFANTVFGTYPATLRSAANGATYAGWTCYYVTA